MASGIPHQPICLPPSPGAATSATSATNAKTQIKTTTFMWRQRALAPFVWRQIRDVRRQAGNRQTGWHEKSLLHPTFIQVPSILCDSARKPFEPGDPYGPAAILYFSYGLPSCTAGEPIQSFCSRRSQDTLRGSHSLTQTTPPGVFDPPPHGYPPHTGSHRPAGRWLPAARRSHPARPGSKTPPDHPRSRARSRRHGPQLTLRSAADASSRLPCVGPVIMARTIALSSIASPRREAEASGQGFGSEDEALAVRSNGWGAAPMHSPASSRVTKACFDREDHIRPKTRQSRSRFRPAASPIRTHITCPQRVSPGIVRGPIR